MTVKLFGWSPNPQGVEAFLNDPKTKHPLFGLAATELMESAGSEPVLLYEPLLSLKPSWTRGSQGIGDCVSWGYELGCTTLAAVDIVMAAAGLRHVESRGVAGLTAAMAGPQPSGCVIGVACCGKTTQQTQVTHPMTWECMTQTVPRTGATGDVVAEVTRGGWMRLPKNIQSRQ